MRVLGIDPGSHRTGWGLIETRGTRLQLLASGVVVAEGDLPARLRCIADTLDRLFAEHLPEQAAVEAIFHHKNSQSALKLGHARGVALLSVARAGVELFEYSPAEIKRASTGNGRAPKELVERMVRMILGVPKSFLADEADALAAAICHAQLKTRAPQAELRP